MSMFTGPMEDRLAIRERFDSYADAVTLIDLDAYLSCWTDDATRGGMGGACRGKDELRTHWAGIWRVVERMVFLTQIGSIDVDGDRARTRSYCSENLRYRTGHTQHLIGMYDDELRRVDGVWLFAARNYRVLVDHGRVAAPTK